jgi:hypothetical protein
MDQGGVASPIFPPRDEAVVKAIACETVAETKLPLSRQSLDDLTTRVHYALGKPISRSTLWRILDGDAIKPWRYEHWIFPRDPRFAEKAGVILDLYAGLWQGLRLGLKNQTTDYPSTDWWNTPTSGAHNRVAGTGSTRGLVPRSSNEHAPRRRTMPGRTRLAVPPRPRKTTSAK